MTPAAPMAGSTPSSCSPRTASAPSAMSGWATRWRPTASSPAWSGSTAISAIPTNRKRQPDRRDRREVDCRPSRPRPRLCRRPPQDHRRGLPLRPAQHRRPRRGGGHHPRSKHRRDRLVRQPSPLPGLVPDRALRLEGVPGRHRRPRPDRRGQHLRRADRHPGGRHRAALHGERPRLARRGQDRHHPQAEWRAQPYHHAGHAPSLSAGPVTAGLVGASGFAAIPTTAIDPPHRAASPAVPALSGPGHLTSLLMAAVTSAGCSQWGACAPSGRSVNRISARACARRRGAAGVTMRSSSAWIAWMGARSRA